jgi:transcription initiation factor TFIIB
MNSYEDIWKCLDDMKAESSNNLNEMRDTSKCKNCFSTSLVEDKMQGDLICTNCGCVNMERIIDEKAEWNYGQDESTFSKDPSRCGCPQNPLLEKSSMSTMVVNATYKKNGNLQRLHQQQSMNHTERARYHVFEYITKMCTDNGRLPSTIIELAKHYYTSMSQKRISRGAIRQGLIACCIYYACKKNKVSRSVGEVAEMCSLDTMVITKSIKIFRRIMGNEIESMSAENTDVDDLFSRFANKIGLDRREEAKLIRCVRNVAENVDNLCILNGKTPTAITTAIIYFCCQHVGLTVSKKHILEINNVSSVTLNKLVDILELNSDDILVQVE